MEEVGDRDFMKRMSKLATTEIVIIVIMIVLTTRMITKLKMM